MDSEALFILISGYCGFGNVGDEAILKVMLRELGTELPAAHFSVVSGDPQSTAARYSDVEAIDRLDLGEVAARIRGADLVIQGGGGLYQDYHGFSVVDLFRNPPQGMALYATIPMLAGIYNKPCMMYAQGIGPLFSREARDFLRTICHFFDAFTVRDDAARDLLQEIGVPTENMLVTADPAFGLTPSSSERVRGILGNEGISEQLTGPILGVSVRPWRWAGDPAVWEGEIAAALDAFLEKHKDVSVLMIPFQLNDVLHENDLFQALRIQERMRYRQQVFAIQRLYDAEDIAGIIGRCSLVLGMRLHALIFAGLTATPMVSLAYDPKVTHLMGRLRCEEFNFELDGVTADSLFQGLEKAWATKDDIERQLKPRVQELAQRAGDNVRVALQLLEAKERKSSQADGHDKGLPVWFSQVRDIPEEARELLIKQETVYEGRVRDKDRVIAKQKAHITGLQHVMSSQLRHSEIEQLREELYRIHTSKWWKLASVYWTIRELPTLLPKIKRKTRPFKERALAQPWALTRQFLFRLTGNGADEQVVEQGTRSWQLAGIEGGLEFLHQSIGKNTPHFFLIFSGTRFSEDEGQRPTRFARELARRNIPVIFAYWRWSQDEEISQSMAFPLIHQIPIDQLTSGYDRLLSFPFPLRVHTTLLLEFPHPLLFEMVNFASAYGWYTIYDVLDDWEEFHRVGQAIWYDRTVEEYIARNVDLVSAVSKPLEQKVSDFGAEHVIRLPNALEVNDDWPAARYRQPKKETDQLCIGYFGHLTDSWFDWSLVANLATKRPSWCFEIIGYGEPDDLALPENIKLLGRVPHTKLWQTTRGWDVAIIPFKRSKLAEAVDPIKVYEYLRLGLPVIVTGIPHLASLPYVWVAEDMASAQRAMCEAATTPLDPKTISDFVGQNTWSARVDALLEHIEACEHYSVVGQLFQCGSLNSDSSSRQ